MLIILPLSGSAQVQDFWNINFDRADSVAFRYHGYSLKHPDHLADSLVVGLNTEVEKFRAIFRWITDNIAYDYPLYLDIVKHERKLKRNKKQVSAFSERVSKRGLRHLIRKRKAICSGYATLLDYMCSHVGIETVFIGGSIRSYSDRNGKHAWNAVKLNNKWYLCDVTWASGVVDPDTGKFFKHYKDIFFLTDPSLLICNHFPSEARWSLLKNGPSRAEFFSSTFKGNGFIRNKINTYSPSTAQIRLKLSDKFIVSFTSNSRSINEEGSITIKKKTDAKYYKEEAVRFQKNKMGEYVMEYAFPEKGSYYVYIYINAADTFVYDITVM